MWEITGRQYRESFQYDGLAAWAALPVFQSFVDRYPAALAPRERMILIDQLLHEFHYALRRVSATGQREHHKLPHRTTADSLIEGSHDQVVAFLDSLTYGEESTAELKATQTEWRKKVQEMQIRRGSGSRTARG
jgi:hypothetical protein